MSNEPLFSAPQAALRPQAPAGNTAAAMILAAIDRLEQVVRGERIAFERLRGELAAMALAIVQAMAAIHADAIKPDGAAGGKGEEKSGERSAEFAGLLHDLGGRVSAMLEILGTLPAAATPPAAAAAAVEMAAAEAVAPEIAEDAADRVPTVSDVVSRLGRPSDALMPAADLTEAEPAAHSPGEDVPTVSMLETMVVALTATPPAAEPEPEAAQAEPPALESIDSPEPASAEAEELSAAAMDAPPPDAANHPVMPEVNLLNHFAPMETMPFLPAEFGTAVIFASRAEPESEPEPETLPEPEPSPVEAQPEPASDGADFAGLAEPDPAAFLLEPQPVDWPSRPPQAAIPAGEASALLAAAAAHDPLAPLKAMSAEETIALFS